MIYFDGVHLASNDLEELHSFAKSIMLSKCWFHNPRGKGKPHYDVINPHMVDNLLNHRKVNIVSKRKILDVLKINFADSKKVRIFVL